MGGGASLRGGSPEVTGYAVPSKEVVSKFAK
jgi:chlorosome envelope protein A